MAARSAAPKSSRVPSTSQRMVLIMPCLPPPPEGRFFSFYHGGSPAARAGFSHKVSAF